MKEIGEHHWTSIPVIGTFYHAFLTSKVYSKNGLVLTRDMKMIVLEYFSSGPIDVKSIVFVKSKTEPNRFDIISYYEYW